jgi:glutamyl-tRNA synthetase
VRFAPSPTGYLHIGGARTALFNWLYARHVGGTFVLRIDDTDEARSTETSTRAIYDALEWLGLDCDEGPGVGGPYAPYVQTERLSRHRDYANRLLAENRAYWCYCAKEELDAKRKQAAAEHRPYRYDGRCRDLSPSERDAFEAEGRPKVLRLRVESQTIRVSDLVLGDVVFESDVLDDFVLMKPNFTPVYIFSSPLDDADMEITHVIRGNDHLSNTPKQILICRALGLPVPEFAHIPMVLNMSGQKLSKRDGAVSVSEYRELGYLPEAMVNYLVRLSWSADGVEEIFTVPELIEKFDLDRVGRSPSRFDSQKLTWLNGEYIARKSVSERTDLVAPFLERAGYDLSGVARERFERIVESVGERLRTLLDITTYAGFFFNDAYEYEADAVKKWFKSDETFAHLEAAMSLLQSVEPFDVATLESRVSEWVHSLEVKPIQVLQPIRVAVTGRTVGPGLYEVLSLLGRDAVVARLRRALSELRR